MSQNSRWEQAQRGETTCWEKSSEKLLTERYQNLKSEYWAKILEKLYRKELLKDKRILDVGCGPSGLVMLLRKGYEITCLDPLMDSYIEMFPYLLDYDARYVNGKIEDHPTKSSYDVIFSFNSIDHVDDIQSALKNLKILLKNDGTFVMTLNCHNYPLIQKILSKTSFIFDSFHPYQYTYYQYDKLLKDAGFKVTKHVILDDETQWINKNTSDEKVSTGTLNLKAALSQLRPSKVFFKMVEVVFGIKRYGGETEKRVYSHIGFICEPDNSAS